MEICHKMHCSWATANVGLTCRHRTLTTLRSKSTIFALVERGEILYGPIVIAENVPLEPGTTLTALPSSFTHVCCCSLTHVPYRLVLRWAVLEARYLIRTDGNLVLWSIRSCTRRIPYLGVPMLKKSFTIRKLVCSAEWIWFGFGLLCFALIQMIWSGALSAHSETGGHGAQ